MKLRIKRKCGSCCYWAGFPYVHCMIGAKIHNKSLTRGCFISCPEDPADCRDRRQGQILEVMG